jgi:peptide/nickel transport system permease protein
MSLEGVLETEIAAKMARFELPRWLGRVFPNWTALAGALIVLIVAVMAIGAPLVAPYAPSQQEVKAAFAPPFFMAGGTASHILGTDALGRDLFSRIIYGLRTSLIVSVSGVALLLVIGITIGMVAGYFGGLVDTLLMRLTDIQMAIPFIVLAITILSVLEPSIPILIGVLALVQWPLYARVIRGITMVEKEADYVIAARAMGASHLRILVQYMLRNSIVSMLILSTLDMAALMIYEALLSFIGIGVQPPTPSLGNVMADGRVYLVTYWWITTLPGLAIFVAILGLNLFGDGMQERLDPRLRRM